MWLTTLTTILIMIMVNQTNNNYSITVDINNAVVDGFAVLIIINVIAVIILLLSLSF